MKTIIAILIFSLTAVSVGRVFADTKTELPVRMLIYGHVYNEDKNSPLNNMRVYITKNGEEIGSEKTDPSGMYKIVSDNRTDLVNICIETTDFSVLKNIKFCEAVSVFQKIGTIVDGVEVRELEHDFFTNTKGENLNEQYNKEVTHADTEAAYSEYEKNIIENTDKEIQKKAEEEFIKKMAVDKAKYRMPNNTEMTGPVKSMRIIGAIVNPGKKTGTWTYLDPEKTIVRVYTHDGVMLKEKPVSWVYDFDITVEPKEDPVFLHPLVLEISNTTTQTVDGEKVPLYENRYFLLNKEKNIINTEMKRFVPTYMDRVIEKPESFPFLTLIVTIAILASAFILVIKNKLFVVREWY